MVDEFTKCAVTTEKCVPQRQDDGAWPVPKREALVQRFSTDALEGEWYISAGLNRAFDNFDCQLHRFEIPADGKLVGNLQWRIKDPVAGSNFVTRYTVQEFVQDPAVPAILYNHDNEFLHYQDDWYVLAEKPNEYVLVYYRGSNDAWDGYGGAVVYTRSPSLDQKYVPELSAAVERIGLKWSDFALNDNTCRAAETKLEELEADLVYVEGRVATGLQLAEREVEAKVREDVAAVESRIETDAAVVEGQFYKKLRSLGERLKPLDF